MDWFCPDRFDPVGTSTRISHVRLTLLYTVLLGQSVHMSVLISNKGWVDGHENLWHESLKNRGLSAGHGISYTDWAGSVPNTLVALYIAILVIFGFNIQEWVALSYVALVGQLVHVCDVKLYNGEADGHDMHLLPSNMGWDTGHRISFGFEIGAVPMYVLFRAYVFVAFGGLAIQDRDWLL